MSYLQQGRADEDGEESGARGPGGASAGWEEVCLTGRFQEHRRLLRYEVKSTWNSEPESLDLSADATNANWCELFNLSNCWISLRLLGLDRITDVSMLSELLLVRYI